MPLKTIGPKVEAQPLNDNFADLENRKVEQSFLLKSAVYDSTNDKIDVTLGPGIADFLQTIITKTADTVYSIPTPAINTSYYIYLKSDGTFTHNTTGAEVDGAVRIWIVATGSTVDAITTTDQRGRVSGSAQAVKDLLDTHEAAVDPHPQYETSAEAQVKADTAESNAKAASVTYKIMEGRLKTYKIFTVLKSSVNKEQLHFEIVGANNYSASARRNIDVMFMMYNNNWSVTAYNLGEIPVYTVKFLLYDDGTNYVGYIQSQDFTDNWALNIKFKNAIPEISPVEQAVAGTLLYNSATSAKEVFHEGNVEYGSNANGEYVRYPNGIQVCWFTKSASVSSGYNAAVDYTLPASFINGDYAVSSNVNGSTNSTDEWFIRAISYSASILRMHVKMNQATTITIDYVAIGRWK
jgi:hypothetical protein